MQCLDPDCYGLQVPRSYKYLLRVIVQTQRRLTRALEVRQRPIIRVIWDTTRTLISILATIGRVRFADFGNCPEDASSSRVLPSDAGPPPSLVQAKDSLDSLYSDGMSTQ
jgi:hypothetical protein